MSQNDQEIKITCKQCGTPNYIFSDMDPPYICGNCGYPLEFKEDKLNKQE